MNDTITQEEYNEIEALVEKATQAYTKAKAKPYIQELEFRKSSFYGNVRNIISSLISMVKAASGQVADKERYLYFVRTDLHKLSGQIKH